MRLLRAGVFASAMTAGFTPAYSQPVNLAEKAVSLEGNCQNIDENTPSILSDGDPKTAWTTYSNGMCELVLRFGETLQASAVSVSTISFNEDKKNAANLLTVWGSHQSFGNVFYKLGQADLTAGDLGIATIAFGEAVNLRSLKIMMENTGQGGWQKNNYGHDVRLADLVIVGPVNTKPVTRWPQKPMQALKGKSDPITSGKETRCDTLAGYPFNPDSHGHSRSDRDINIPEALAACEIAIAKSPQSVRLAFNLARVELLAERAPRAIARLTQPLLADYAPAQFLLARSFENGTGVEKSEPIANDLYKKSAQQDFGPALFSLALTAKVETTQKISEGNEATDDEAIEPYLKRAIEIGYLPAIPHYFEHVMKYGLKTPKEAYALLEEAAEQGDTIALAEYAINLYNGYKINRRFTDSRHYSIKLSQLNQHASMTNLSRFDTADNRHYWRKRGSYGGGYYSLEHLAYSLGAGEKRQHLSRLAFDEAVKDAKAGDHWAMEWVAQYYKKGFGTKNDPVEERAWRCRARAAGNPVALTSNLPNIPGQLYNGNC